MVKRSLKIRIALGVLLWLTISLGFNYPALFADSQALSERWGQQQKYYRKDMSISMLVGLIPIGGTVVAVFVTGFCEHGFKWR